MPNRTIALLALLTSLGCQDAETIEGCRNDNDCKGERVCDAVRKVCVEPGGGEDGSMSVEDLGQDSDLPTGVDMSQGGGDMSQGGGDMSQGGADMSDPALDQACGALAEAYCSRLEACAKYRLERTYGTRAACAARHKLTCLPRAGLAGSSLTPARLTACAGAYPGFACDRFLAQRSIPDGCKPTPGTLANGMACVDHLQCSSGFCTGELAACGTCVKASAEGGACAADNQCDFGLVCAFGGKCRKPGELLADCGGMYPPCRSGLVCRIPIGGINGTCSNPQALGAICGPQTPCGEGLFCDPGTSKCVTATLAAAGQSCGGAVGCLGSGRCSNVMGTMRCVAPAPDGAMCNDANGPSCLQPAACTMGTCRIFDPASCR